VEHVSLGVVVDARRVLRQYVQARLFAYFANSGFHDALARFRATARQVPIEPSIAMLDQQHAALLVEDDGSRA